MTLDTKWNDDSCEKQKSLIDNKIISIYKKRLFVKFWGMIPLNHAPLLDLELF
jgi:hypothetical protein